MKKKLLVSFSGGRTSGFMLWYILNVWSKREEFDITVIFANTGKEHEGTLEFVKKCGEEWGIDIVWIEAVHRINGKLLSKKGWKVGHKVVDFNSASRNGEPFEEMISVLGVPCSEAPFCSDQLKRKPIESYLKSIGWRQFYKAIGIRADEIDRVNPKFKEKKIIYPLVSDIQVTKQDVLKWWRGNNFNLEVPKDLGNCDNCWKKDFKVLVRNSKNYPDSFNWWQRMIDTYKTIRAKGKKVSFFRGGKTIKEIFEMNKKTEEEVNLFSEQFKLDGCSESCEVYK